MIKVIIVNNGNQNEEEFCVVALFITRKYKRKKNGNKWRKNLFLELL